MDVIGRYLRGLLAFAVLMTAAGLGCGEAPGTDSVEKTTDALNVQVDVWNHDGLSLTRAGNVWVDGTGNVKMSSFSGTVFIFRRYPGWNGRLDCKIRMVQTNIVVPSWLPSGYGVGQGVVWGWASNGNIPAGTGENRWGCFEWNSSRTAGVWRTVSNGEVYVFNSSSPNNLGVEVWNGGGASGYQRVSSSFQPGTI